jgi:7-cyano-7-deazaguanine synthase
LLKTIALVSGGLDSVVNFKCALDRGEVARALTFDYGQAAAADEVRAAGEVAARFAVAHSVVPLPWYKDLVANPLMGKGEIARHGERVSGEPAHLLEEAWIPNRNCVLLAIGAAFAEGLGARGVVVGFNREEAEVFPDNSSAFLGRMNAALGLSTLSGVEAVCYTVAMTKVEIVKLGVEVGAPLELVYSCYRKSADHRMCGHCQSCVRLKAALKANGVLDTYAGRFAG